MNIKLLPINQCPVLGIDINDSSIKVVALKKEKNTYRLENYAKVNLPKNAVIEREIKDVETVAACLKEAICFSKIIAKYGAVALPDALVMTKIIAIEKGLSAVEFEEQIMFEASKHIPYSLEEIYIDYHLTDSTPYTVDTKSVFIAASRIETVNTYLRVLEKVNLTPKLVDVESFALYKAGISFIKGFKNTNIIAVIDIGTLRTTIVIYNHGVPIFTRTELFGTDFLTQGIADDQGYLFNNNDQKNAILYETFKQNLLQYLKRALQFYSSIDNTGMIEKIVLTGMIAKLKDPEALLKAEFNQETIVADPVSELTFGSKVNIDMAVKTSAELMIAIGLALRSFD